MPGVDSDAAGKATLSIDAASANFLLTLNIVGLDKADLHADELTDGSLATILGEDLTIDVSKRVKVNNAYGIEADLGATNGVVHAINKVLMPPSP